MCKTVSKSYLLKCQLFSKVNSSIVYFSRYFQSGPKCCERDVHKALSKTKFKFLSRSQLCYLRLSIRWVSWNAFFTYKPFLWVLASILIQQCDTGNSRGLVCTNRSKQQNEVWQNHSKMSFSMCDSPTEVKVLICFL